MKPFCRLLFVALAALLAAGCQSTQARRGSPYERGRVTKPVIGVADFENLANFPGQWNLGGGMADLLTTELLRTERVVVLERKDIGDVLGEIMRQGQELFRPEGRAERGRLKNAQYLVHGVVTDFTETAGGGGWFGISWLKLFGRGSRARVAINVKVSDVETGEIVASVKAASTVGAGRAGGEARYKQISFGGDAFFRTPLGRATETAIRIAVRDILRELPSMRWRPRVAEALGDTVIINGGENLRVRVGETFLVRSQGREITDPNTGNVIERVPGSVIGRIRVVEVKPQSAHAVLEHGQADRGCDLEPVR